MSVSAVEEFPFKSIFDDLAAKIPNVQQKPDGKGGFYPYIDKYQAMDRLNEVLGPANWEEHYMLLPGLPDQAPIGTIIHCDIIITLPDGTKLKRGDGTAVIDTRNVGPDLWVEQAYASAFKRACVKFGIAAYLKEEGRERRMRSQGQGGGGSWGGRQGGQQPQRAPARSGQQSQGGGQQPQHGGQGQQRGGGQQPPRDRGRPDKPGLVLYKQFVANKIDLKWIEDYGSVNNFPARMLNWSEEQAREAEAAFWDQHGERQEA